MRNANSDHSAAIKGDSASAETRSTIFIDKALGVFTANIVDVVGSVFVGIDSIVIWETFFRERPIHTKFSLSFRKLDHMIFFYFDASEHVVTALDEIAKKVSQTHKDVFEGFHNTSTPHASFLRQGPTTFVIHLNGTIWPSYGNPEAAVLSFCGASESDEEQQLEGTYTGNIIDVFRRIFVQDHTLFKAFQTIKPLHATFHVAIRETDACLRYEFDTAAEVVSNLTDIVDKLIDDSLSDDFTFQVKSPKQFVVSLSSAYFDFGIVFSNPEGLFRGCNVESIVNRSSFLDRAGENKSSRNQSPTTPRKTLSQIQALSDLDSRVINAAALLEYELRLLESNSMPEATLGDLVQHHRALFSHSTFVRDVNFALGIRNAIAHLKGAPTDAEKSRAAEYLIQAIGIVRQHTGTQDEPIPFETARKDTFDSTATEAALKAIYRRRLRVAGVVAGVVVIAAFVVCNIIRKDSFAAVALPGALFCAVALVFVTLFDKRISHSQYYSLPGSRYENGDHRCIHCGARGRDGRGIYIHGQYKSNAKFHECSKCSKRLFVS